MHRLLQPAASYLAAGQEGGERSSTPQTADGSCNMIGPPISVWRKEILKREAALMVYMNTGYLCHCDLSHLHLVERYYHSRAELWPFSRRIADPRRRILAVSSQAPEAPAQVLHLSFEAH